jgi:hypothetical protein
MRWLELEPERLVSTQYTVLQSSAIEVDLEVALVGQSVKNKAPGPGRLLLLLSQPACHPPAGCRCAVKRRGLWFGNAVQSPAAAAWKPFQRRNPAIC